MTAQIRVDVEKFWKQGYLLIPEVFRKEEIDAFRQRVLADRGWKGDLLSHPYLRRVLLDDRVLDISAQILGGTATYYGDGSLSVGQHSAGFHKDNADREDRAAPDWRGKYTQIRFGLYLQDHAWHSGGLRLVPGSHHETPGQGGRPINVRSRVGDLVVWNLRTDHDGRAVLVRHFPWAYADSQVGGDGTRRYRVPLRRGYILRVPAFLMAPEPAERAAVFFTVGRDDAHRERYSRYLMSRAYMVEMLQHSEYEPDVWEAVRGKNLKVIDLAAEVRQRQNAGDPSLGVNRQYAPIPY